MHTIQTVTVQDSEMEVFLFMPQGEGPHPGLILAQHIPVGHTGLENDEFTLRTAERYALNGFAVAAPFIFHWWPEDEDIAVKREAFRDDWTVADGSPGSALVTSISRPASCFTAGASRSGMPTQAPRRLSWPGRSPAL